jgi:hypothetical protein
VQTRPRQRNKPFRSLRTQQCAYANQRNPTGRFPRSKTPPY